MALNICEHAAYFYCTVASDPVVFLCLSEAQLHDANLQQAESSLICEGEERKDVCHFNLVGWNDGKCKRLIAPLSIKPENFTICDENGERPLTIKDIENWRENNPEY